MTQPDVFRYLDYRAFLRDWFDARKAANPRFSHRAFVRRTGQKSPSLLADVMERRRNLTPALIPAFISAMKLERDEGRFFEKLVALDQARTPEDRNAAWEQLAATRRFREARRVEGDSFRYLSHWHYPAIRELAKRPDFQADPAWLAATLRPKVTPAQAAQALDALFELGMLVRDGDAVVQAEGAVVTPREVVGLAVDNYHRGMLALASEGIRGFKAAERHYTGVTVCVPEALMPELKQEINAFAERLLELCDGASGDAQRVFQINLNTFPLSASTQEDQ